MSTATITKPVPRPKPLELVINNKRKDQAEVPSLQQNPLAPVFVAMFVAFILSVGMVGMIVMWIALRHSGALPFESIGR